jgi:hypothetical protein
VSTRLLGLKPAQVFLQVLQNRATLVYDCTVPQGSAHVPTQALNNEVAYMMMKALALAFDICLTGLVASAHLDGREGVIRGDDPANDERWTARLDDGTCVSCRGRWLSRQR